MRVCDYAIEEAMAMLKCAFFRYCLFSGDCVRPVKGHNYLPSGVHCHIPRYAGVYGATGKGEYSGNLGLQLSLWMRSGM